METIDPQYRLGIESIDIQHARWLGLVEQFRSIASAHPTDQIGKEAAEKALNAMLEYTRSHFASEEKLLLSHRYPHIKEHKQKHAEIEMEILRIQDEMETSKTRVMPLKVNLLITSWILDHILKEDRAYADYMLGDGGSAP